MKLYIDQSGKVEKTSKSTVVAFSNGKQKAIFISSIEKRKIQKIFRDAHKPDMFTYKTFAVLIYLLIKNHLKQIDAIVIDQEYHGKEPLIKKYVVELIRKGGDTFDTQDIHFSEISKHNNAHKKAISVFRKNMKPEMIVKYSDLLEWIL